MFSVVYIDIFNDADAVVQIAACTFDAHVQEILGALVISATVVMLHPYGNMDYMYLISTVQNKQVTLIVAVPALIKELCDIIKERNIPTLTSIRSFISAG
jgi:non-ribosomal peptide synthetase component F